MLRKKSKNKLRKFKLRSEKGQSQVNDFQRTKFFYKIQSLYIINTHTNHKYIYIYIRIHYPLYVPAFKKLV